MCRSSHSQSHPSLPDSLTLEHLDALRVQLAGTVCGLTCRAPRARRAALTGAASLALEQLLPRLHAPADLRFESFVGRIVEAPAHQLVGQVLLVGDAALLGVRVLVSAAVAELLHE